MEVARPPRPRLDPPRLDLPRRPPREPHHVARAVGRGGNTVSGQTVAGGALGGLVGGIAIAAIATRNLDTQETQASAPAYPALFARDADGHWEVGMPAPTPVFDVRGTRTVGASLPALGGLF